MGSNEVWLAAKVLELQQQLDDMRGRLDAVLRLLQYENAELEAFLDRAGRAEATV